MTEVTRRRGLYYGWVLVVALALTEITSFGVLYYGFTVFLTPMETELGWSRAALTGAFSLAILVSAVGAIPVGRLLDRYGPRALMTVGSVAATLLVLAWSRVMDLTLFYVVWAAIGVTMAAVLYEPAFFVVARWFSRRRGRALTVLTFLAGFASVIYLPLIGWLVREQGWRAALVTLAVLIAAGTIPIHALLLRRSPEDMGLLPDGASAPAEGRAGDPLAGRGEAGWAPEPERSFSLGVALRDAAFWWLTAAFSLNMLGAVAVSVHLVPYLIGAGYGQEFAVAAAGLIGLMALPGRLIFTPLGDRVPRGLVTASIFLLQAVSLVVLLVFQSPAGVLAFVVMGARAVAPVGVGVGYDRIGGYEPLLWALAAISLLGAGAVLVAEALARRRAEPSTTPA